MGSPVAQWWVNNPPIKREHVGLIPGSGRSPGEGDDNPLQYSCLGNLMDGGVWWATAHEVTKDLFNHDLVIKQ